MATRTGADVGAAGKTETGIGEEAIAALQATIRTIINRGKVPQIRKYMCLACNVSADYFKF